MSRFDWFDHSGLGLFVHWGLYAIPAKGEWHLWKNRVPLGEYDALAGRFAPPDSFSPEEWVLLAKRMGAKYAVLTTRHHDGFCLWDTDTTSFNSVRSAAGRDFVREFADACRRHGIRVGFYYSIMNWQFRKREGCEPGRPLWEEMVNDCHAALRELMTRYGKVDLLWYDGCSAPGVDDAEALDRVWRTKELNAMVRSLQPEIVINDRSGQPEDYSTPEQSLAAPPRGRRWESCMTVNGSWGYTEGDRDWKSPETLVRAALHCARFGGRLLLNVGPRADGSVPTECVRRLEALGDYIAAAPQAFHGAVRDDWTEATHEAGVVVKTNSGYFLHDLRSFREGCGEGCGPSPVRPPRLDGAERLEAVAPGVWSVCFRAGAKPCRWLGGRHDVEIKAGNAPVLGDASDRYTPPEGKVWRAFGPLRGPCGPLSQAFGPVSGPCGPLSRAFGPVSRPSALKGGEAADLTPRSGDLQARSADLQARSADLQARSADLQARSADLQARSADLMPQGGVSGRWRLEIGFVNDEGFKDTFATEVDCAHLPIVDNDIYAYRLSPLWRIVPPSSFELAGKFPSPWYRDVLDPGPMRETMARDMVALAAEARFEPLGARNALCDRSDERVNFAYGAPDTATLGFGLARTMLRSDRDQTIMACIGQDWWSDIYLNGARLAPLGANRPAFQGHKPIPFLLPLRAGDNELLVANHGGNRANWFALWTNAN